MFFLSRAAGDDDSYSLRFFRDLSARVTELTEGDGDVGFIDLDNRPDVGRESTWSAPAWNALTSCQVFVALCSPRYFLNDRCGREWWIFADRLRRYEQATSRTAPALIPVPWSGTAPAISNPDVSTPPGVGENDADQSEEAAVRHLVRLRSLRPRYEAYVESLAEQIVELTRTHEIPPLPSEFTADLDAGSVPSAFDDGGVDGSTIQAPDPTLFAAAAAQHVHFVVAAGSRTEMAEVRDDLQFYGDRSQDWAPYRPTLSGSLAAHARTVAARRQFDAEIADLDNLATRIDRARRNNEIVVLLVDSWITKISEYRRELLVFDERDEPAVAVLAPANGTDPETARHRGELRSELRSAFRHSMARRDQLVRIDIDDTESFETDLVTVLEEAQNRIFRHGKVFRRPANDAPAGRPILQGP